MLISLQKAVVSARLDELREYACDLSLTNMSPHFWATSLFMAFNVSVMLVGILSLHIPRLTAIQASRAVRSL